MESPIQTLIDLGNAIINDDDYRINKCGQGEPTIYTIIESHDYPTDDDHADDWYVFSKSDSSYESPLNIETALIDYIKGGEMLTDETATGDDLKNRIEFVADYFFATPEVTEVEKAIKSARRWELSEILDELEATVIPILHVGKLRNDAFALTKAGIEDVIRRNGHNMARGAHSFAAYAYRCSEIEQLKKALRQLATDTQHKVSICPKCGHETEFSMELYEHDDDPNIQKTCECFECGTKWIETYTHVDTKIIDENDTQ